jgi:hypothetical protein
MVVERKRTEIPCILCNNAIKLPEYVGQNYSGDLLCSRCGSLLHIKLNRWEVEQYRVLGDRFEEWKGVEKLKYLQEMSLEASAKPEKSSKAGAE